MTTENYGSERDGSEPPRVTRRRLLQLLAASGAAVGIDVLLPAKWTTPSVAAIPDPAPDPLIGALHVFWRPVNGDSGYYNGTARFHYLDEAGDISGNSSFFAVGDKQGIIANGQFIGNIGGQYIPYNSTVGTMRFPLPETSVANTAEKLSMKISAASDPGRMSNVLGGVFNVGGFGVLNISDLAVYTNSQLNSAVQLSSDAECSTTAVFHYNGSMQNMVGNSTALYAWQNSTGWISPGVPIDNMNGTVIRNTHYSGMVSIPLPNALNDSSPFDLTIFLEDTAYSYNSNELSTTFAGCSSPTIVDLSNQLCSPDVQGGEIGCKYNVTISYYDAGGAISSASRVTIKLDEDTLIDDKMLSELGVSVTNPVQGNLTIPVLIPSTGEANGALHELTATLVNDEAYPSNEAKSPVTQICQPNFPLDIETTSTGLATNQSDLWLVNFAFNDSAGVITNGARIVAEVNSSGILTTIYNGLPIGGAGGLTANGYYSYFPNGAFNCTISPVNATVGNGYFSFNYTEPSGAQSASEDPIYPTLNWFLVEPAFRDSDAQQAVLDPGSIVEPPEPPKLPPRTYLPITTAD